MKKEEPLPATEVSAQQPLGAKSEQEYSDSTKLNPGGNSEDAYDPRQEKNEDGIEWIY